MDKIIENIIGSAMWVMLVLFGHAGLWSSVVQAFWSFVSLVVFIAVFIVSLLLVRNPRIKGVIHKFAKVVLMIQVTVLSLILSVLMGANGQEESLSRFLIVMIPVFILSAGVGFFAINKLSNPKNNKNDMQ